MGRLIESRIVEEEFSKVGLNNPLPKSLIPGTR